MASSRRHFPDHQRSKTHEEELGFDSDDELCGGELGFAELFHFFYLKKKQQQYFNSKKTQQNSNSNILFKEVVKYLISYCVLIYLVFFKQNT